ncbi:MAG: hypothetical protein RLZZ81_21 [Pseudomonadota bacterium]|jgi:hypothetical protein
MAKTKGREIETDTATLTTGISYGGTGMVSGCYLTTSSYFIPSIRLDVPPSSSSKQDSGYINPEKDELPCDLIKKMKDFGLELTGAVPEESS